MAAAEKISITMTPEMARLIRETVDAGEYASTSEVIRDALRVWQRERDERAQRLTSIRTRINSALASPAPDLDDDEADAALETAMRQIDKDLKRAAS